ncbi:MAG: trimethylamine methyltransferase family protein, partial [Candidatus Hodarchaeales archaeon]
MTREGISLSSNKRLWNPLTKNEMEKIEETAYRMLQEIGFSVEVDEVLDICKKMGCQIDPEKKIATFSKEIVDEFIKKAPKEVFFAGRTQENDVVFEPGKKTFFMAGTAAPRITKWSEEKKEYEYKDATSEDIEYSLKFIESLEHIDHLLDPPLIDHKITAAGLPDWIHAVQMTLNGCTKHIGRLTCNYFREEWDYYAQLAGEVVGGIEELSKRPILASATDGVSPGNIHKKCGWNMLGAAKYGIPSATSMGAVNPVGHPITLAGYLATAWAGHLGHLAITQASRPGLPSILYIPAGSI